MKINSNLMIVPEAPIVKALAVVGGKWKMLILLLIAYSDYGILRYGELRYLVKEMAPRVLTQQLRDLETSGLLYRNVYQTLPLKVEYSLTELGKEFIPVLDALIQFGRAYKEWSKTQAPENPVEKNENVLEEDDLPYGAPLPFFR